MAEEKNFENRVKQFLKDEGCYFIKYWGGAAFTKSGVPDILSCIKGRFFGIETKARHGEPTLLQLKHLADIRQAGGFGVLLYPDDFQEFKKIVQDIQIADCRYDDWYLRNIKTQEEWKKKLERR